MAVLFKRVEGREVSRTVAPTADDIGAVGGMPGLGWRRVWPYARQISFRQMQFLDTKCIP